MLTNSHQFQRLTQFPPCCVATAGVDGLGRLFHVRNVAPNVRERIPQTSMNKTTAFWPGTSVRKSTGNAFTARPAVFAGDKAEIAKATLERNRKKTPAKVRRSISVEPRSYGAIPNALKSGGGNVSR